MDAGDGDVGVVAPDGAADRFGEELWILRGADEEIGGVRRLVVEGKVDHVDGRVAEGVTVRVGDDADYGEGLVVNEELTTEGAAAGPYGFGGGLGDDGVGEVAIAVVEWTAFDDGLAEGVEVAGTDPAIVGEG